MASLAKASCAQVIPRAYGSAPVVRPALPSRRCPAIARAQQNKAADVAPEARIASAVSLGAAASMLLAENADAAAEIAQLAAGDNRVGVISTLFVPALGWVGFNMLQPALNQLNKMSEAKDEADPSFRRARSVASAIGLGAAASMLLAEHADAASEVAQLAASDNRVGVISTLFVPALGWVGFNMLQPALNQLNKMSEAKDEADPSFKRARSVASAIGLGAAASMLLAEHADAATEVAQLAASDNRVGVIATLFIPALGWVGFNMLQPLLNQLTKMTEAKDVADPSVKRKRSIASAVGLGAAASMLLAENADAATEVAQLAASDNRVGVIATLFVPALGWVGFNMLQPALNQLNKMSEAKDEADPSVKRKRSIASAVGLGAAASMFLAENADAATEVAQLAAGDNRVGVIATLFVPALGWVGFNMLQPALNQLNKMSEAKDSASPSSPVARRK